jgi:mRNA interferase YafQ
VRVPAYSGQSKRDARAAEKRGKEISKLRSLMTLLIDDTPLPASYLDHPLKGHMRSFRDAHIEPDWLLVYKIDGETVRFERTGRHADLFDE